MEWLALRSDLDSLAGETHAITMMPIHSAKGLEFPAVFVAGMEAVSYTHLDVYTRQASSPSPCPPRSTSRTCCPCR